MTNSVIKNCNFVHYFFREGGYLDCDQFSLLLFSLSMDGGRVRREIVPNSLYSLFFFILNSSLSGYLLISKSLFIFYLQFFSTLLRTYKRNNLLTASIFPLKALLMLCWICKMFSPRPFLQNFLKIRYLILNILKSCSLFDGEKLVWKNKSW